MVCTLLSGCPAERFPGTQLLSYFCPRPFLSWHRPGEEMCSAQLFTGRSLDPGCAAVRETEERLGGIALVKRCSISAPPVARLVGKQLRWNAREGKQWQIHVSVLRSTELQYKGLSAEGRHLDSDAQIYLRVQSIKKGNSPNGLCSCLVGKVDGGSWFRS